MSMYKVGIVGAGRVGRRRAATAHAHPASTVTLIYDERPSAAAELATVYGATVAASREELIEADIDIAVVSTTHDALAPISTAALLAGKHVLCEKPLGRNPREARPAVVAAERSGRVLKVGYNHRYHPAIQKLHAVCTTGEIGPLLSIRARYGHGGRPGYDREWRTNPERAGGGELLDQGAHLIDLAKWLLGDFAEVTGYAETHFWDSPVEDNAYGLFRTTTGQIASLHASWTQWKNLFSFEVFGRDGYVCAEGLGGAYGPERAIVGRRNPRGGAPDSECFDYPDEDRSWELEWADFLRGLAGAGVPHSLGREALETLEWIYRLYRAATEGHSVRREEPLTV